MEPKNPIVIDGVDVSGCCQYMPRHMEDYDIDTLDYCRYHFKPCKDVDVKYCYYKQLKRKEQECEELKEALTEIRKIAEREIKRAPDGETFARPEIKKILQKICDCEVKNEN